MTGETDPLLRRLQIGAIVWCLGAAGAALAVWPARWDVTAGILGGGLLTAVSFLAIKTSIDALIGLVTPAAVPGATAPADARPDTPGRRRIAARAVLKLAARYGLLALLAYGMIARLRLHPLGLMVGASSLVASASFEAARWVSGSRPAPPRVT